MTIVNTAANGKKLLIEELSASSGLPTEKVEPIYDKAIEVFDVAFKKKVVWMVVALFALSLGFLWFGLWWIATEEYSLLHSKPPVVKTPIITERLLLALIAGTVTQISVAFIFMVKYLFGDKKAE